MTPVVFSGRPMSLADRITDILDRVTADAASARPLPESTYRVQFHKDFTFRDATAITPYLRDLGITHLYASPYLKARPGSQHGYDISDHQSLNPEIGNDAEYAFWIDAL